MSSQNQIRSKQELHCDASHRDGTRFELPVLGPTGFEPAATGYLSDTKRDHRLEDCCTVFCERIFSQRRIPCLSTFNALHSHHENACG